MSATYKRIPFQLYRLSKCTNTLHCSGLLHLLSAMYMYVPVLRVYDTPLSVLNIDIRSQTTHQVRTNTVTNTLNEQQ